MNHPQFYMLHTHNTTAFFMWNTSIIQKFLVVLTSAVICAENGGTYFSTRNGIRRKPAEDAARASVFIRAMNVAL
jgi:hypothetical protein